MRNKNVSVMVEGALMIALSFGLSFIRIFRMPQGGSVTLGAMVPLLIFDLRHGAGPGILAGVAFGLLDVIGDPYIVHPAQLILDYPLAYGLLGLAGLFRKNEVVGAFVGIFARFLAHFASGIIFFASYAEGNVYAYSAGYQGSYLLPEFVISAVILLVLRRTAIMNKV